MFGKNAKAKRLEFLQSEHLTITVPELLEHRDAKKLLWLNTSYGKELWAVCSMSDDYDPSQQILRNGKLIIPRPSWEASVVLSKELSIELFELAVEVRPKIKE